MREFQISFSTRQKKSLNSHNSRLRKKGIHSIVKYNVAIAVNPVLKNTAIALKTIKFATPAVSVLTAETGKLQQIWTPGKLLIKHANAPKQTAYNLTVIAIKKVFTVVLNAIATTAAISLRN